VYPVPAYTAPVQVLPPDNDNTNTTIFVGNLDPNVTEEELKQFFSPLGEIVYVKIPAAKGCGFGVTGCEVINYELYILLHDLFMRMNQTDIEKIAFHMHHGHFEFLVVSFGFMNALQPLFDNSLIDRESWEEHLHHFSKWSYSDPSKIKVVLDWSPAHSTKALRDFSDWSDITKNSSKIMDKQRLTTSPQQHCHSKLMGFDFKVEYKEINALNTLKKCGPKLSKRLSILVGPLERASLCTKAVNKGKSIPLEEDLSEEDLSADRSMSQTSAEEAIQRMQGQMIGQQVVRISWGRGPTAKQDLPGAWGTQVDPNQWSAYYGYGQGYDAYAYGATQDPSLYAYGAYAGYAQYSQQARYFDALIEGSQEMAAMTAAVPGVEQREESYDPLATPDVDK
ncbi:hypothetical protein Goarm_018598, partial [Gossypium armourianum]|nr:hypothetical protein [Gossypium armourianum]